MSLCVCICKCRSPWKTKENFRSSGTGGADSYELSNMGVEYQILVLKKGRKLSQLLNYLSSLNHIYLLSMLLRYLRHCHTSFHWTYFSFFLPCPLCSPREFHFYFPVTCVCVYTHMLIYTYICLYTYSCMYEVMFTHICVIYVILCIYITSEKKNMYAIYSHKLYLSIIVWSGWQ